MASSVLESSEEKTYGFKLMRLIVGGGTEALKNVFLNIHPGNLQTVLYAHHTTLNHLFKTKRIITQPQWDKLYPHPPKIPNIQEFDITLLVILLRNICSLSPPSTGWNAMPISSNKSREANIVRIKLLRNNFFGHIPRTDVSRLDFEARWVEVSSTLLGLGLHQAEIDRLKAEECGEEEVNRVRKKWSESDKEIVSKLDGFEKMVKEVRELSHESLKQAKSLSDDILTKNLHWCDFENEIQLLVGRYTKGTREWVFEQVLAWLNDKSSDNRAFIISGQAGMGKSTIAAVICKLFPKHFAACHFFQYNDSRYNNPKFLLQSLAWQLSHVFPEYKENLTSNLSGNKRRILHDTNIEALFSILFKEPFTWCTPDPDISFLIVIDALDESRQEDRYELVDLITKHFHKFPSCIRFLITTRSEKDIIRKFQPLNPIFLERDDERNLNDVRLFFGEKLKTTTECVPREDLVENLIEMSEGLMLYASFICKLSEENFIKSNTESLPRGIEEIYETYFKRLENELKIIGIEEEKFLSLLNVVAVVKQPLPLAFIEKLLFPENDSLRARRVLLQLTSCISSLLVVKDDCISIFHKSVNDWLVKPNHYFTIFERYGHKSLADICIYQMERLKQNEVRFTYDLVIQYSLQNGIPHILLAEMEEKQSLTKLIGFVTDLEIVHASVCTDVYTTLSNLAYLASHNMYQSLCAKTQATLNSLIRIIRKFIHILKGIPQSFLQHVVNEKIGELSAKASALLLTRYKGLAYFESEDVEQRALIGRILTTDKVLDVDISPSEDFVICGYETKGIELFSLSDFKSVWKIDDFAVERINDKEIRHYDVVPRCIVFHPLVNVIFPGQLDLVLNLEGKLEPGPITCIKSPTKFTCCCFSHDNTKMATNCGEHLIVWNLLQKKKVVSLSCRSSLHSILFSGDDRFIATTDMWRFCVYDTEKSYSVTSRFIGKCPEVVVSTFNLDSWYSWRLFGDGCAIVRHDLKHQYFSSDFLLLPLNARAVVEFQSVMESKTPMWFQKIGRHGKFFILSNGRALVFKHSDMHELKILSIIELTQNSKLKQEYDKYLAESFVRVESTIISADGRYIYTSSPYSGLYKSMLSSTQPSKSWKLVQVEHSNTPLVSVTNGVFFVRRPRKDEVEFVGGIPELWNADVTERLFSFPELTGTFRCLSVAEDLVACIMASQVCFFDIVKKEIVARTQLPEVEVIACGSQYHVLSREETILLLQDTNVVDLSSHVLSNLRPAVKAIKPACFSPSGGLLVFFSRRNKRLYILDILTLEIRSQIILEIRKSELKFVDEEHVLCEGYNKDCLLLINVKTCDILTSIDVDMDYSRWRFSVCLKTSTILVFDLQCKQFKVIKLWLPQQRQDASELLESCSSSNA